MAVSELLAESNTGWKGAAVMGAATGVPILAIGAPWLFLGRTWATVVSIGVALVLAGVIAELRGARWKSWTETYGVLIGVSIVAALSGLL